VVAVVAGGVLGLTSLGALSAAGWATWQTNTQRDASGYLTTSRHTVTAAGPAITTVKIGELADRSYAGLLGDVRVRATSTEPDTGVFIGVTATPTVDSYLAGVDRTAVTGWYPPETENIPGAAAAAATAPVDTHIWTAQVSGSGSQSLTWRPRSGTSVVVMHPDGSAGVSAAIDFGVDAPGLTGLAVVGFVAGGLLAAAAVVLIVAALRPRPELIANQPWKE
jgi:hypothetical protein